MLNIIFNHRVYSYEVETSLLGILLTKWLRTNDLPNAQWPRGSHSVDISALSSLSSQAAFDLDRIHTLPLFAMIDLRISIQCVWISEFF